MEVNSVTEARKAVEGLRQILSHETFHHLEKSVNNALDDVLEVKRAIDEPLPVDQDGQPQFASLELAIKRFVDERDALRVAMANAKKIEDEAKDRMAKISMWLRDKGDELGVDSFKTQYGTAYRSVKISYRVGDWSSFVNWIKDTDNFQCLEKRVAKLATKEIHDASGELPPGIDFNAEVEFDIRRPTKRAGGSDE